MSLHAIINPDALQRLNDQKRQATVSSVLISILSMILIGLVLAFYLLPTIEHREADITTYYSDSNPDEPKQKPLMNRLFSKKRPPAAPSNAAPSITARVISSFTIPEVDSLSETIGLHASDGDGDGLEGDGPGTGGFIPNRPADIHSQRCSKTDRLARLKQNGGSPEIENSVVKALRWLKKNQSSDGSWGSSHKTGMTGLALLAYLGHCEDPSSEEFGDSCLQAIVYLLDIGSKNEGRLTMDNNNKHWPYEHAIATYALAEAYTFAKRSSAFVPRHKEVLLQAGQWIIEHQHGSGGWDYNYDMSGKRGGDLSVSAWQIQALKACQVTGLKFHGMKGTVKKALEYVTLRQAPNGGFGYTGTQPVAAANHHSLTGAALLAYQMWGKGSRTEVRKGARYILANAELDYNSASCDLYAHYYHSQAMMQRGGKQWAEYNAHFRDQIFLNQNASGAWKKPGGNEKPKAAGSLFANETKEGIHYRTCLCTLMLEVYYRYLPATR